MGESKHLAQSFAKPSVSRGDAVRNTLPSKGLSPSGSSVYGNRAGWSSAPVPCLLNQPRGAAGSLLFCELLFYVLVPTDTAH